MIPELEGVTPEQALRLMNSPRALDAWMASVGLSRAPAGFVGALASLAFRVIESLAAEADERREAARRSVANRRRVDRDMLLVYVTATDGRLPPRMRQVHTLCIEEGMTCDQAARSMGISRETVRVHLRRLRALARRSARAKLPI